MGQENDSSRVPTLEDLTHLCAELNKKKAKYIVIGGMAVLQHGFVRATEDIDLLVEASIENERAVIEAVSTLKDGAAREIKPGEIAQFEVIRVADEVVVDLMKRASGIEYAEGARHILRVQLNGIEIPFADIDLMIKLKQGVRPKDQMDLAYLKSLKRGL